VRTDARPRRSPWRWGLVGLLALSAAWWLRLNVSASVPLGLYLLTSVPVAPAVGTLVVLPVPTALRRYQTMPLLKPVAAVAGDEVCSVETGLSFHELWIAGRDYGPVLHDDGAGHPLPYIEGCFVVEDGAVFVASPVPRSMDGRYNGSTAIATLTARALPLLTWR
jgi:type IV secretory pathway protease TraF